MENHVGDWCPSINPALVLWPPALGYITCAAHVTRITISTPQVTHTTVSLHMPTDLEPPTPR